MADTADASNDAIKILREMQHHVHEMDDRVFGFVSEFHGDISMLIKARAHDFESHEDVIPPELHGLFIAASLYRAMAKVFEMQSHTFLKPDQN